MQITNNLIESIENSTIMQIKFLDDEGNYFILDYEHDSDFIEDLKEDLLDYLYSKRAY